MRIGRSSVRVTRRELLEAAVCGVASFAGCRASVSDARAPQPAPVSDAQAPIGGTADTGCSPLMYGASGLGGGARRAMIREATTSDLPFLEEMLYEAFFWSGGTERPTLVEMRARPEFDSLLAAWGRAGDVALLARVAGAAAGAAWFRLWTPALHSYGFVDEQTPELGLAVARQFRGQGIGRELLRSLIEHAGQHAYPGLSLSVAPSNPARRLYESEGFRKVGEVGTSWTMVRKLSK
jgi:ribosomal protein S18 acetylase RimI-like enzyme